VNSYPTAECDYQTQQPIFISIFHPMMAIELNYSDSGNLTKTFTHWQYLTKLENENILQGASPKFPE